MLDVILFNMARSVNISRRLHSEKFDPIESFVPIGQCDDFRKYIFNVFYEDCESTRGKKCDPSRARWFRRCQRFQNSIYTGVQLASELKMEVVLNMYTYINI